MRMGATCSNIDPERGRVRIAFSEVHANRPRVKLVKRQLNGNEHIVLKENASIDDLRLEAERLKYVLGYQVEADPHGGYLARHDFYRGKFIMSLEAD